MTNHLHPDGFAVSETPICDANIVEWEAYYRGKGPEPLSHIALPEMLERRARTAEADVFELQKQLAKALYVIAWFNNPNRYDFTYKIGNVTSAEVLVSGIAVARGEIKP